MKKSLLLIIIITLLMMTGCKEKGEFTSFIPTPVPESEDGSEAAVTDDTEDTKENASETPEETPTPKPVHVGQTTTKYVKLDKYDAILNVRATPSREGDIVGFLVHTEKVEVIEISNGWASFAQNGELRYVSADFLVDERPDYIKPPAPTKKPAPTSKPAPNTKPSQNNTSDQDSELETEMEEAPPEI